MSNAHLEQLAALSDQFNSEAEQKRNIAGILDAAGAALKAEIAQNAELKIRLKQHEAAADALGKLETIRKGESLVFLVDSSGSTLHQGLLALMRHGIDTFARHADVRTSVFLWGSDNIVPAPREHNAGQGMDSRFAPVASFLANARDKNFIVLTDGDISDISSATEQMTKLLASRPDITFDFVEIGNEKHTSRVLPYMQSAHTMTIGLKKLFPMQVNYSLSTAEDIPSALTSIAISRLETKRRQTGPAHNR